MSPQLNPTLAERATDGLVAEYNAFRAEYRGLQDRIERLAPHINGLRSELVHRSYEIPCPKHRCRAEADHYCVNLNSGGTKRFPHAERIAAYFAVIGSDEPDGLTSWEAR